MVCVSVSLSFWCMCVYVCVSVCAVNSEQYVGVLHAAWWPAARRANQRYSDETGAVQRSDINWWETHGKFNRKAQIFTVSTFRFGGIKMFNQGNMNVCANWGAKQQHITFWVCIPISVIIMHNNFCTSVSISPTRVDVCHRDPEGPGSEREPDGVLRHHTPDWLLWRHTEHYAAGSRSLQGNQTKRESCWRDKKTSLELLNLYVTCFGRWPVWVRRTCLSSVWEAAPLKTSCPGLMTASTFNSPTCSSYIANQVFARTHAHIFKYCE